MIPASRYSPKAADQLLQYLLEEWHRAKTDRYPLEEKWKTWQQMYRQQPEQENKTFPFPGCSNVVVPIIAADVDTIHARIMAMLFGQDNLWTPRAFRPDMTEFSRSLREFLEWAQNNELDVYNAISDWVMEICKLGTGVLKTRYHRENRKVYEFREIVDQMTGQVRPTEQQVRVLLKDSPRLHHVSLFDFYVPATAVDLESATWCAERIMLTWPQLLNRANAGIYTNLGILNSWRGTSRGSTYQEFMQKLDRNVSSQGDLYETVEFWLDWDIDGDGEQEAIVTSIHPDTRTMMRLDFNPFFNQQKPYDVARYLRQEKRFYGIGICEMQEQTQDEVSTLHNQRIDNKTIANSQVIIALKNGNIKQGEPIFPGRVLLVDAIDEVKMQSFGTVYDTDSTVVDEQMAVSYGKQRTGVNDFIGANDSPTVAYAAATTATNQMREGAKKFDQVFREIRSALSGSGTKIVELYQQFSQGKKSYFALGEKDGALVEKVLTFPTELVRSGVFIDVTATSAAHSKEVEIRTNTIVLQQLTQLYAQILQAMQIVVNPQLPSQMRMVASQAIQAGTVLMGRMLELQGIQDYERLLPDMNQMMGGMQPNGGLGPVAAAFGGGMPMAAQPQGAPGVPALPPGLGGVSQFAA